MMYIFIGCLCVIIIGLLISILKNLIDINLVVTQIQPVSHRKFREMKEEVEYMRWKVEHFEKCLMRGGNIEKNNNTIRNWVKNNVCVEEGE